MKIFFIIKGSVIIVAGAVISVLMLIGRQFVLYQAWDIALVFVVSLLISVFPFSMAVVFTRLEKVERMQSEDYDLLSRKIAALRKLVKNGDSEAQGEPNARKMLLEGTAKAADAAVMPVISIGEPGEVPKSELEDTAPIPVKTSAAKPNAGMVGNRIIRIMLVSAGAAMMGLSIYYFVQIILGNLWFDTTFRTVQILLFIGGAGFMVLAKILKNQEEILQNVRLIDSKRDAGDTDGK